MIDNFNPNNIVESEKNNKYTSYSINKGEKTVYCLRSWDELACGDTVKPGLHGIHVHKSGDLSRGCESTCSHYNPDGNVHGDATGKKRHRGDLGNILVSDNGTCNDTFVANVNVYEIIGRGLILHDDQDDLGKGENEESLKTGNAGKRIACGVLVLLE